jgi:hypothetical protein
VGVQIRIRRYGSKETSQLKSIDTKEAQQGGGPGTLFNSMVAAALDWGMRYNDNSIMARKEFASIIYEVQVNSVKYYSYTKPRIGSALFSNRSRSGVRFKDVGDIHSHGEFLDPSDENFSPDDIRGINKSGWVAYLTTPTGALYKYGISDPLNKNLPSDMQAGNLRWNNNDAAPGPKNEPTFGISDWIALPYPGIGWRSLK